MVASDEVVSHFWRVGMGMTWRKGSGSYVVEFPAMLSYNGRIPCVPNMINVE